MPKALGRGLGSLIPQRIQKVGRRDDNDIVVSVTSEEDAKRLVEVNPKKIQLNPYQPRQNFKKEALDELKQSIKKYGLIQPLVVTELSSGRYELIAGERRLRASVELKLDKIPVIVRDATSQEKLEVALVENLQREDLNPVERALGCRKLMDEFCLTAVEVAERVSLAPSTVTNALRLLNLPEKIQQALIDGKLYEQHAQTIAGLATEAQQNELYDKIITTGMSTLAAWRESRKMGGTKRALLKSHDYDNQAEKDLREVLNSNVIIRRTLKGGKMIIEFYNEDALHKIVEKLKRRLDDGK